MENGLSDHSDAGHSGLGGSGHSLHRPLILVRVLCGAALVIAIIVLFLVVQQNKADQAAAQQQAAIKTAALSSGVNVLRRQVQSLGGTPAVPPAAQVVQGATGQPGRDSTVPGPASTVPGPTGAPGQPGKDSVVPGPAGQPGKDGTNGQDGKDSVVPGPSGPAGEPGPGCPSWTPTSRGYYVCTSPSPDPSPAPALLLTAVGLYSRREKLARAL